MEIKSEIIFENEKLKNSFYKLKEAKNENRKIYEGIVNSFENLEKNAFSGIQIPKKQIPKEYIKKFGKLNNLWKYNLPEAWRLIYTIKSEKIIVLSIILEWLPHKEYERRFGY